ncbi:hypothetical protein Dimus_019305 [Dionaea muscipula]
MRMRRIGCSRSCLRRSLRVVNILVNMCGVGMIIYSIWLLKKWDEGVSQLPPESRSSLPRPWFILVSLAVGIIICLSTLFGHMVANCDSKSVLSIYVISIFSLVLLQGGVIIAIFFKMDLASQLVKYIDDEHKSFKSFIMFHLYMCRVISIMALVAQISVVLLAVTLWIVGTEPAVRHDVPDLKHSFLISDDDDEEEEEEEDSPRTRNRVDFLLRTSSPIEI